MRRDSRRAPRVRRQSFGARVSTWSRRLFLFCLLLSLVAGGFFGTRAVRRFVFETEYFKVRDVIVRGAGDALEADARESLRRHFERDGDNLAALDVPTLELTLTQLPRARDARVRRIWPQTLLVEFEERRPIAIVNLEGPCLVDPDGFLLARIHGLEAARAGLPILTGVQATAILGPGDCLEGDRIAHVLEAVKFIDAHDPGLRKRIVEWNVSSRDEVTAILVGGTEVRFGERHPIELLHKLSGGFNLPEVRREFEQATYIDLRIDSQLVVMPRKL